jgi:HlyD family secretion protein
LQNNPAVKDRVKERNHTVKTRNVIVAISLIAVAAVAILVVRNQRAQRSTNLAEYETVPVRQDTLLATVNASGVVKPKEQVNLTFPSGGLLAEMNVEPGQAVEAGEELARLDSRQLGLSAAQAEATLRISEAGLAQALAGPDDADIAAAEAAVESAQASLERLLAGPTAYDLRSAKLSVDAARDQLWSAQAQRDSTKGNPLSTQAAIDAAEAQVLVAEVNVEQAILAQERLGEPANEADVALARSQLAQAEAQLQKLRQMPTEEDLAVAKAQVAQAQAALAQAKLRIDDATLTAPFAGTVLATNASVGELVGAAVPVVVLADLESYHVDSSIDETDIGRVQLEQEADIVLDAFPDVTLRGKVSRIEPLGQSTQGVVSYGVRVQVLSAEVALRPNMTAIVDIVVDRKESVLVVPNRAIRRETSGRRYVEILNGQGVEQRYVTTGLSNDLVTEIISGLNEGDEVVVSAPRESVLEQFGGFGFGGSR